MRTLNGASKKQILDFMTEHPADIGRVIGFRDFTEMHNRWIKKMILPPGDFTLQAHRGSYKTTCLSEAIALRMIFYPHENMIFMRKTAGDVVEVVRQVSKILRSECVGYLYQRIYGTPLTITSENSTSLVLNNYDTTRGAAQLLGIGTVGSITGKHADCVITDDIVNLQDRVSTSERNRIKRFYMELQNIKNPGGVIINTGTPWHKEDAFSLMPNIEKYDCYTTGILTDKQIENLRVSMAPSLFAANYELRHIASENALFDTTPEIVDDPDLLRDGIAHIDAAYDGGDYTAFTCGKRVKDTIYLYGKLWRKHVDTVLDRIMADVTKFKCAPVYCEQNGDKGFLGRDIRQKGGYAYVYTEHQNKFIKISSYLRKWWPNIKFIKGTDPEYIAQILDFTDAAEHDDAPDSAACVVRILDRR